MKKCKKCFKTYLKSTFPASPIMPDGYSTVCRDCQNEQLETARAARKPINKIDAQLMSDFNRIFMNCNPPA